MKHIALACFLLTAFGSGTRAIASPAAALPCPRFAAGSQLAEPRDLFSVNGVLRVVLRYRSRVDSNGAVLFCYTDASGAQSPTLHVHPGDELVITLKNELPPSLAMTGMAGMPMAQAGALAISASCGSGPMTPTSTNLHFHGTNTPPICHQDEVIKTVVNGGDTFEYDVHFPLDEPPGLYWYHPHIHGISESAVQGGASGAIIVEGIQNFFPEIAGLQQRLLVVRDNPIPGVLDSDGDTDEPGWDISVNYTPVAFPDYTPAKLAILPIKKQLWRVLNASADTILDLQLQYDGVAQPVQLVALDGVPTNSQDGAEGGVPVTRKHILLPPAGRAEFVMSPPGPRVKSAQLVTLNIDTGPDGDNDPNRPILELEVDPHAAPAPLLPPINGAPLARQRFANLKAAKPAVDRKIYFSEVLSDPNNPDSATNFYITVDGQAPVLFSPDNPPAITTTQGSVEDWTIENRALENHEFHIHQIHFLVLEKDHLPVDGEYLDTINVPYWSGSGPYPNVKLRMDFRGDVVGDFVYHCHILGHEDGGMMAVVRVLPKP